MAKTASVHGRWRRIEELFHAASALGVDERAALLRAECDGDQELQREVESLLAQDDATTSMFPLTSGEHIQEINSNAVQRFAVGEQVGPYEIVSLAGSGGMAEVYVARDTRLNRQVAIKVIAAQLASNPAFRKRFKREMRLIAALNHENICTVYDVGHYEEMDYLVLELLEGRSLAEILRVEGRAPIQFLLTVALQISAALAEAHRRGVVHSDLTPANIMVVGDRVKLMDFGLARVLSSRTSGESTGSTNGILLGTLPYMAPEQLEGRSTDERVDIFAFGAILHEMATGVPLFNSDTRAGMIQAILTRPVPRLGEFRDDLPADLDELIHRSLKRPVEDRWPTVESLRQTLHDIYRLMERRAMLGKPLGEHLAEGTPDAHDAYRRAIFLIDNRPAGWLSASRNELKRALRDAPRFAAAHAALSRWHSLAAFRRARDNRVNLTALRRAEKHARVATELDGKSWEAHLALAFVELCRWRVSKAHSLYTQAAELAPTESRVWGQLGQCLCLLGQSESALVAVERATNLNKQSTVISEVAAGVFYGTRRFERCVQECNRGIQLSPQNSILHYFKGLSLHFMNDAKNAEASLLQSLAIWNDNAIPRSALGVVAIARGDVDAAIAIETALRAEHADPYTIASLSCALGKDSEALDQLEQVFRYRSPNLLNLWAEPLFDDLKRLPRFLRLVKAVGLEFRPEANELPER